MLVTLPFVFLLFPDGRLPARGWRWLVRFTIALAVGYAIGTILLPGPLYFFETLARNPFGVEALRPVAQAAVDLGERGQRDRDNLPHYARPSIAAALSRSKKWSRRVSTASSRRWPLGSKK